MSALPHLRHPSPRRSATAQRRPRLRVVTPPSRARRYVVAIAVTATAAIFGCVSLNAMAAEHAFTALALGNEVHELGLRTEELTVEIARLESPRRIRQVARDDLGLVTPDEPGYLVVNSDTSAQFAATLGTIRPAVARRDRAAKKDDS